MRAASELRFSSWRRIISRICRRSEPRRLDRLPAFAAVLSPDRWLLWLAFCSSLSVSLFPTGRTLNVSRHARSGKAIDTNQLVGKAGAGPAMSQ